MWEAGSQARQEATFASRKACTYSAYDRRSNMLCTWGGAGLCREGGDLAYPDCNFGESSLPDRLPHLLVMPTTYVHYFSKLACIHGLEMFLMVDYTHMRRCLV